MNNTEKSRTQAHPHGVSKQLLSIYDEYGKKHFVTEIENIEEIFLHPEVRDRKIVVLSVIGAYRKGKSFFLDYCLRFLYANYRSINNSNEPISIPDDYVGLHWLGDGDAKLQGFSWAHGRKADTKGIKMWSDVFLHDTPADKIAIVVMDTQGLFEPGSTHEENGRIFGLSTLISSIQILNIKNELQEDQIEYLEMATNLAKIITKKQKSTDWKPFQRLLFLFRDWTDAVIGYGYDGGRKYLNEEVLAVYENENSKGNVIRKNIRDSFEEILCFLLDNPGKTITKGHGEWSTLEKDFVTNLEILIESLLSPKNLVIKSNLGKDLTADKFQALMKIYFNAFANAILPDTENILQMGIENQMQTIVNAQLKVFNQLQADLDIDFDREDFVEWVEEVHENNTKTPVDGFLKAEKLDDEESSMKYEEILRNEIGIIFENWKQTNMKIYEDLKDQKLSREIESCLSLQIINYQETMNKDLDFNQDYFELYYEELHKSAKAIAMDGLAKMIFKDEESRKIAVNSLEETISENYETLRTSKIAEFNQYLSFVSMHTETQFEVYKTNLYLNVFEYENHDDFKSFINEKFSSAKDAAIVRFENSEQLVFIPKKAQFKENLIKKIDSEYKTWKDETMKIYEGIQDKKNLREVESNVDLQVKNYEEVMSNNLDFNQDDFETYYEDLHSSTVANAVQELEKMKFKDKVSQKNFIRTLEDKLNEIYLNLKPSKTVEFNQQLKLVALLVDSQLDAYKIDMNHEIEYENHIDFESYIEEKQLSAKNAAIDRFENSQQLSFTPRKTQFEKELNGKIDNEYLTWKDATMEIYEKFQDQKHQTEIEKCINLQVINYQKIMSTKIDFNQDDFEKYYEDLHQTTMANATQELRKFSFKDETIKSNSTKTLEERLDEHYGAFSGSKIAEFNQHLRAVSSIADTQFENYKKDLNLNLNYDNPTDFEKNINEKHLTAKNTSIDGFDNLQRMTFAPRKAQFRTELITNIDSEFKTWKDATIKIYEQFQEQKCQIAIEKCLNLQPKNYRNVMNIVDFNQDDFEKYYEDLHKSTMANEVKKFHKLTFKDAANKQSLTKSLEDELSEIYKSLKHTKIAEYNQHLKVVSTLADTQLEAYKSDLYQNLSYEKYYNFEKHLEKIHLTSKNAVLNKFEKTTLTFAPKKSQLIQKLTSNIDSGYPTWKAATIKTFNIKVNEKMQQFLTSQQIKYKNSFGEYINLKQNDSLNVIKTRHDTTKLINLHEFKDATNFLHSQATQSTHMTQLATSIDSAYNIWYSTIKSEHESYIEDLLKTNHENKFQRYKNLIGKIEDDFRNSNYESYMNGMLNSEKTTAIADFKTENRGIVDQSRVTTYATFLSNDIDSFKSNFMTEKIKTYNELRTDGIWVKWNGSYSGIPKYAVIAGDAMEDDSNMYFARHNENDQEVHVGWYHSSWPTATFSCGSNVKSFKNFEILTHTNYTWVSKLKQHILVVAHSGTNSNGKKYRIGMGRRNMRNEYDVRKFFPGKLVLEENENHKCYTVTNTVQVYEIEFDYLVRAS